VDVQEPAPNQVQAPLEKGPHASLRDDTLMQRWASLISIEGMLDNGCGAEGSSAQGKPQRRTAYFTFDSRVSSWRGQRGYVCNESVAGAHKICAWQCMCSLNQNGTPGSGRVLSLENERQRAV
jgi:hypothetical protein